VAASKRRVSKRRSSSETTGSADVSSLAMAFAKEAAS
jgi:hypothetical protein